MGSKWRKLKLALGLKTCVYVPGAVKVKNNSPPLLKRFSNADFHSPTVSKETCSICLATMKSEDGQATFTAECSHSFHFHCIVSNVKHGNQICPVCRAKWNEVPLQNQNSNSNSNSAPPTPPQRARINPIIYLPQSNNGLEPSVFNDDESLNNQSDSNSAKTGYSNKNAANDFKRTVLIKTFPEVSAVAQCNALDEFTILIHLKAPVSISEHNFNTNHANLSQVSQTPRATVDLVTVLDISGSMAGTKLALLKRAVEFVIQNLGPNDRLAVVAFSSSARRVFPLRRMSDTGRQMALQAVNSLVANGGTNIAKGLRKGAKVMEDRREKNPIGSIILLSDGQDSYAADGSRIQENHHPLLPLSIHGEGNSGFKIPVHSFGFGTDHDASTMHSISELSGGTFSFIETEGAIQDAFAQCIGGILSVVVNELLVIIYGVHPSIRLGSIKAGSYAKRVAPDGRTGFIEVGDLYAEEERDFLVSVNVPADFASGETSLLKLKLLYNDPSTKEMSSLESEEVRIKRPVIGGLEDVSIEVDRQRNRVQAAEAMKQAQAAAEEGNLARAVSIIENFRRALSETLSAKSPDQLCVSLEAELKEMQERMASRRVYEASGRAYILSGMSSHSWQRATARGNSTNGSSLVRSYQTPSMATMLSRSQATLVGGPSAQRLARPLQSSQPKRK